MPLVASPAFPSRAKSETEIMTISLIHIFEDIL